MTMAPNRESVETSERREPRSRRARTLLRRAGAARAVPALGIAALLVVLAVRVPASGDGVDADDARAARATPAPTPSAASAAFAPRTDRASWQRMQPVEPAPEEIGVAVYVGDREVRGYRPEPALVTKTTEVREARFPATDIHCHWTIDRDPDELLRAMDERGVLRAVNLSGGHGEALDAMLARFTAYAPGRLLVFANLDFDAWDDPGWAERMVLMLERASARGLAGLKIFKGLGLYHRDASGDLIAVDDPKLDPVWAACGRLGLPVLIHTADPVAFFTPVDRFNERWMQLNRHPDWSFFGKDVPPREALLEARDRVLARHPGTTFIGPHMAGNSEDLEALAARLERFPNLVVDVSGRVGELGRQPYSARRLFLRFPDRILFGTDRYPGRPDQPRYRLYYRFLETDDEHFRPYVHPFAPSGDWMIYGIFLPDDVLERVYRTNAERILPSRVLDALDPARLPASLRARLEDGPRP